MTMSTGQTVHDVAIIGAGVVGCALAVELVRRFGNVLLIDKETSVGFHTSGRNSGVVHSGFNPKPGTLKAALCVEGNRLIRQYCKERGVPCEQVGTYVVAVVSFGHRTDCNGGRGRVKSGRLARVPSLASFDMVA